MTNRMTNRGGLSSPWWPRIHAARAALADDLAGLADPEWAAPSLCGDWTVREALAHLTAGATTSTPAWLRSVVGARGDFDRHNAARLAEHLGASPAETLARFRAAVASRAAVAGPRIALMGEIVIHGEDIRRPLGLEPRTDPDTADELLAWFAAHEYTVVSRSRVRGLRLHARDTGTTIGEGPSVTGPALSLLLAICGRSAHLDDLSGDGVKQLAARMDA